MSQLRESCKLENDFLEWNTQILMTETQEKHFSRKTMDSLRKFAISFKLLKFSSLATAWIRSQVNSIPLKT